MRAVTGNGFGATIAAPDFAVVARDLQAGDKCNMLLDLGLEDPLRKRGANADCAQWRFSTVMVSKPQFPLSCAQN